MASKKTVLLKSKERMTREQVATLLRELADRLSEGNVTFERAGENVTVAVPGQLRLALKIKEKQKRKGLKQALKLQLSWIQGEEAGSVTLR